MVCLTQIFNSLHSPKGQIMIISECCIRKGKEFCNGTAFLLVLFAFIRKTQGMKKEFEILQLRSYHYTQLFCPVLSAGLLSIVSRIAEYSDQYL